MKSIKKLFMIGLTSIVCAGFIACSSDDDEKEVTLPTVFEGKRIAQYETTINGITERKKFQYDNGKLISYSEYEISNKETIEDKYTIEYGNQVRISWQDGNDSEVCTYSLNENGFATSAILVTKEDEDVWNTHYTFEYDTNGYLIKITEKSDGEDAKIIEIERNDGDVLSFSYDDSQYTYTYTSNINKGGILPIDNGWLDVEAELHIAYYAGILGKPTKHLIASQKEKFGYNSYEETYEYVLDADEYVKTCTINSKGYVSSYNYIFK